MKNKIHRAVHSVWSSFPSSLPNFFTATNSKTVQLSTGKIQLNAELTFLPNTERIELLYRLCQCLRCDFTDPHDGNVVNFTPYWAECETNFNSPAPPFNHISGIC